jgi:hypothetical protein
MRNYEKYLASSRDAKVKGKTLYIFSLALFVMFIIGFFAYAFAFGVVFVDSKFWNDHTERAYTGGNIMSVILTIFFGIVAVFRSMEHFKALTET